MSIKLITLKCPGCGASIEIEADRKHAFCTYCGAKILIHNENEHVYHYIDEAELLHAQTDREIRLKEMEYIEKKRAEADEKQREIERKVKRIKKAAVVSFGTGVLLYILAYFLLSLATNRDPNSFDLLSYLALCYCFLFLLSFVLYIVAVRKEKRQKKMNE